MKSPIPDAEITPGSASFDTIGVALNQRHEPVTSTQSFKIYELLNSQFQQREKARALTEAIEAVIDEKILADTMQFESSFKKDLEILRSDIVGSLRLEMREQKVDTIKWFVGMFVALALMIIGLYVKK